MAPFKVISVISILNFGLKRACIVPEVFSEISLVMRRVKGGEKRSVGRMRIFLSWVGLL